MTTTLSLSRSPDLRTRMDTWLAARGPRLERIVDGVARGASRSLLVAILLAFGAYKFTAEEARSIAPLVANSPFMGWTYRFGSVQVVSNVLGVIEILLALLLASQRWAPRAALLGGLGAMAMFVVTTSFLFTTPGLSSDEGTFGFLVKDPFLFAASALVTSTSLRAVLQRLPARP